MLLRVIYYSIGTDGWTYNFDYVQNVYMYTPIVCGDQFELILESITDEYGQLSYRHNSEMQTVIESNVLLKDKAFNLAISMGMFERRGEAQEIELVDFKICHK